MFHFMKALRAKPPKDMARAARVLITPWGEALEFAHVLEEHPRPQLAREPVTMLNGMWTCAFVASGHAPSGDLEAVCVAAEPPASEAFATQIVVPFSPEAPLSGVGRQLQPDELLWYRREVELPALAEGRRLLLHFDGVDFACAVRVNGSLVGTHEGGYLPFCFDITEHVTPGVNELCVCVADPSELGGQPRGKQRLDASGIWYTAQSGIWQSVWLEEVPAAHIEWLRIEEASAEGELRVRLGLTVPGDAEPERVRMSVCDGGEMVVRAWGAVHDGGCEIALQLPRIARWSPEDPHLYQLEFEFGEDRVASYCGFRTVEVAPDANGVPRILLNGEPFFIRGVLDQGYWPDGLMTASSDAALVHDIEQMRSVGFNALRKHIKVESARWYWHCDRLGMLVVQDMASGGAAKLDDWTLSYKPTLLRRSWDHYDDTTPAHLARLGSADKRYQRQWRETATDAVDLLKGHPCIVAWTAFNEGWGQFDSKAGCELIRAADPTRPIVATSGWYDQGAGDIRGVHNYFRDMEVWPDAHGRAFVVSEFGGYVYRVEEHSVMEGSYGYEVHEDLASWQAAVRGLLAEMDALEADGLAGCIYTQLSDVEEEVNGILTYDRRLNKLASE